MAKTRSKSQELNYSKYKTSNRFEFNRKRKLTRLLKANPNNPQIAQALKDIRKPRSAPLVPKWSHTAIKDASMFAKFSKQYPSGIKYPQLQKGTGFSLGLRAHDGKGNLVWS